MQHALGVALVGGVEEGVVDRHLDFSKQKSERNDDHLPGECCCVDSPSSALKRRQLDETDEEVSDGRPPVTRALLRTTDARQLEE